jgi:hypothetical protein
MSNEQEGLIYIDSSIWEDPFFADEPMTGVTAYLWVGTNGPVRFNPLWLERQWKWKKGKALPFIRKMLANGLFVEEKGMLRAVQLPDAQPHPELIPGDSWSAKRQRVFIRDQHRCVYCGSGGPFHCDHIVPKSRGGLDVESNLATACIPCNLSKGARTPDEWMPQ